MSNRNNQRGFYNQQNIMINGNMMNANSLPGSGKTMRNEKIINSFQLRDSKFGNNMQNKKGQKQFNNNNNNVNNTIDNNNNNENKQSSKTTFYRQQNKNSNDFVTTELNFDNPNSNNLRMTFITPLSRSICYKQIDKYNLGEFFMSELSKNYSSKKISQKF
jgi:hypothetical protein